MTPLIEDTRPEINPTPTRNNNGRGKGYPEYVFYYH